MSSPKICTQVPVPDGLLQVSEVVAVQENPSNRHQLDEGYGAGEEFLRLAAPISSLWDTGRTLRVKILNGTPKIRAKIAQYANVWTEYANLKFEFVNDPDAEIRVNVDNSGQSWSRVGTGCLVVPLSEQTMNLGWLTDTTSDEEFSRVITHEFGHAIGCIHEHQSPASGIPWNKQAVYEYYMTSQHWTQAQVNVNIFQLYDRTTTQFSDFDPSSIMLYSVPASLTINQSYSTPWNTRLSETDKTFISEVYPAQKYETGVFSTAELKMKATRSAVQRQVFVKPYNSTPDIAVGLTSLELGPTTTVGVMAFADRISSKTADIHIQTPAGTTLGSAAATWFKATPTFDGDFQIGQANTLNSGTGPAARNAIPITFERSYAQPPTVIVWLSAFELGQARNWRVAATASSITAQGFVLNLDTTSDSVLLSASASWVAFPTQKAGVAGGSFSTLDAPGRDQEAPGRRAAYQGQAPISPYTTFQAIGPPSRILVALNSIDMGSTDVLRLKVSASAASTVAISWNIETWGGNSVLYSAGASYIAFT